MDAKQTLLYTLKLCELDDKIALANNAPYDMDIIKVDTTLTETLS